jgi:protoporphyrinogen oxidase
MWAILAPCGGAEGDSSVCRSGAKVTLFESEDTCGGHTLTDSTGQWPVDLGFQVSVLRLTAAPSKSPTVAQLLHVFSYCSQ